MSPKLSDAFAGARAALSPMLAAAPFGLLFGALAIDNGLTIAQTLMMSAFIFAGASQMVGLELFDAHVAPWLIVFSIFAVNFRHVLYSAVFGRRSAGFTTLQRYVAFFLLIDPQFAETEKRADQGKPITFAWYVGGGLFFYICWFAVTWLGAIFGSLIENPKALGLDFLLSVYFLGLVMGFRKRLNWLPVVVASALGAVAAYHFVGSPWHVSLGALAGIAVAAIRGNPEHKALQV